MFDDGHGRWVRGLLAIGGLLGVSGVALGAASAHLGGGEFGRLAAFFLLLHAAAMPGVLVLPVGSATARITVSSLMAVGVILFSGDLGFLAFTGRTPVSGMAPTGGLLLMTAWLGLCLLALFGAGRSSTPP